MSTGSKIQELRDQIYYRNIELKSLTENIQYHEEQILLLKNRWNDAHERRTADENELAQRIEEEMTHDE